MESAETLTQTATSTDIVTQQAREKAASIPEENLQRELLAQLYIQNKTIGNIKGHLTFYTFMLIASFILAIAMFGK